jgi:hypothetical protein
MYFPADQKKSSANLYDYVVNPYLKHTVWGRWYWFSDKIFLLKVSGLFMIN